MKEQVTVHWTEANEGVRQYVYAYSCANGYDPCDMSFWNLFMYTEPYSDETWELAWNMMYSAKFPDGNITLNKDFVNYQYNGKNWVCIQ